MTLQIHILHQIFFQCLQVFMLCWENIWVPQPSKLPYVVNFSTDKLTLSKQHLRHRCWLQKGHSYHYQNPSSSITCTIAFWNSGTSISYSDADKMLQHTWMRCLIWSCLSSWPGNREHSLICFNILKQFWPSKLHLWTTHARWHFPVSAVKRIVGFTFIIKFQIFSGCWFVFFFFKHMQ